MSTFDAGSIVGRMVLDLGSWTSRVKTTLSEALSLKKKVADIGDGAKQAKAGVDSLGSSLGSLPGLLAQVTGAAGIGMVAKSFINAAATSENYRVRLEALMGSAAAGNQVFQDMSQYARETAFTYEEIMGAATNLSGVLKGGAEQVAAWMPIIGDLAAASGLSIQETTGQIQRMLSAGAGAADLFRERGVLAMLGFTAGVQYSAKESAEILVKEWEKAGSRFNGLAGRLGDTWSGQVSMLVDKWFIFRNAIMDTGVFDGLKSALKSVNAFLDESLSGLQEWLSGHSEAVARAIVGVGAVLGLLAGVAAVKVLWAGLAATLTGLGTLMGGIAAGPAALLIATLVAGAIAAAVHWNKTKAVIASFGEGVNKVYAALVRGWAWVVDSVEKGIFRLGVAFGKLEVFMLRVLDRITPGSMDKVIRDTQTYVDVYAEMAQTSSGYVKSLRAEADAAAAVAKEFHQMGVDALAADMVATDSTGGVKEALRKVIAEAQGAVDMFLGIGEGAEKGAGKAKDAASKLAEQANALALSLSPVAGAVAKVREQVDLLKSHGLLTDDRRSVLAAETWKGIQDYSGNAINAVIAKVREADAALGEMLDAQRISAMAEAVKKVLAEIQPPDLKLKTEILDHMETLRRGGALTEGTASLLLASYWDRLKDKPREYVDAFVAALGSGDMEKAKDALQMKDTMAGGKSLFDELTGGAALQEAIAGLQQVSAYVEDLKARGELTGSDTSLFAAGFWEQFRYLGTDAVESIMAAVPGLDQSIKDAVDKSIGHAKRLDKAARLNAASDTVSELGNAISQLGPKFQKAAQAAQLASKVMQMAADAATGNWVAFAIHGIEAAAMALDLFNSKAEEGYDAVKKMQEEFANAVNQWADGLTDAIIEFVKTGEFHFKEFVDSVLEDMMRIIIRYGLIQPLLEGVGISMNAKGNAFSGGNIIPFAKGGVLRGPTLAPMALMGEAGPEAVMPLKRMGDGSLGVKASGGGVAVTVIDQSTRPHGMDVATEEKVLPDGTRVVEVLIRDAVRKAIADGGLDGEMGRFYGMRRKGVV